MKIIKKAIKIIGIVLLLAAIAAGSFFMIYARPFMQQMKETHITQYDKDLTIVLGGGGNSGILSSDSLVLVIDTKMDEAAEAFYAQVKKIAGDKPIWVINTHYHPDHTKGNKYYEKATILAGANYSKEFWIKEAGAESLPTKWVQDSLTLKMGDETVTIVNLAKNIHTQSDIVVYLHKRKMLFAGDIILNRAAPFILGFADPEGYLTTLDAFPKQFDIQTVVPGHGELGGIELISNFKQYFNDMKVAAQDDTQKEKLMAKYKDWKQIPIFMSPNATVNAFKKAK